MPLTPKFPIYIPSKSRAATATTPGALDLLGLDYRIVVEEQQLDEYAAHHDPAKLLVLDPAYQRDYDTFDDLGDSKSKGPGPARNFIWEHSIAAGAEWHWVMDDNILFFARFHQNRRMRVADGTIFHAMEDFTLRYTNVGMSGPHYWMFTPSRAKHPPYQIGRRVYSCNLIRNDVPFRWRGRYNEDTDLSLRMLKTGWNTILFHAFLQQKLVTQAMAGGNTEAFYADEGTLAKSAMLVRMHPDVTKLVKRFGRWHHQVDYRPFRHLTLKRRNDYVPSPEAIYEMKLVKR